MSHIMLGSPASFPPGASGRTRTGNWQPLPFIKSGFVIHPYHPITTPPSSSDYYPINGESSKAAARGNRFSWSGVDGGPKGKGGKANTYEIPVDVGDEFFAFEEYRCSLEEDGRGVVWYRGYVVQAASWFSLAPTPTTPTSTTSPASFPRPEPSVLIGIFPASVVHVRPGDTSDDGSLTTAYEKAVRLAEEQSRNGPPSWMGEMEAVKEEEEDATSPARSERRVIDIPSEGKPHSLPTTNGISRHNRPKSLVLPANGMTGGEEDKQQPPLPRLTAGDSTVAGQQWPLVDEIACAIREWYGRLPTYLANRDYRLFSTVIQHIDALFLGRRQLLSQTLTGDELVTVRRECVSRLVKCNVAQGLEVIVRSLEDGSVMVVDRDRAYSGASWVGGISCYVQQVQFAYIDIVPLDGFSGKGSSLRSPTHLLSNAKSPKRLKFPSPNGHTTPVEPSTGSYYHCFLDVHAFIASPCTPGETAELYFSLFNRDENRFVTEEFCLVLNHLGSPARDPEQRLGRLRTLFVDLKHEDVADSIFLVCRMVRNGALKMRSENFSSPGAMLDTHVRKGSVRRPSANTGTLRSSSSIVDSITDDSFSMNSDFGRQTTMTIDTTVTTTASIVDGRPSFRRPLGCAVLELPHLSKLMTQGGDKTGTGLEFPMPIFSSRDENTFANLHESIIHGRTKDHVTSSRAESIVVSLKVFQGVASQIVREHPSLLSDVPLSARLGFPEAVYPGTSRNDLYVKLWSACFAPSPVSSGGSIRVRKTAMPSNNGNVQVTVEVRKTDGTVIPDAIYAGGSGEPPVVQYHSLVFQHNDKPTYGELIKVSLAKQATDCHLFLTFRSRGKERHLNPDFQELERPFAFAYLPLFSSTECIKDGSHDLFLYRMEKNLQPAPNLYFDAPFIVDSDSVRSLNIVKSMTPLRDRMMLRTYLCSSQFTQDDTLRALFAWQRSSTDAGILPSLLQMFGFVSEEEIAKFVPSVFDALFRILVANLGDSQDAVDNLVFNCLMKVLAMTSDRRFPNFITILDVYIVSQFNHPAISSHLLHSMQSLMTNPKAKEYRSFLKVWHLFFRFIIRSRELDRAPGVGLDATSAHIEADFKRQTRAILTEINTLMLSKDKGLIGTQVLAVQHYADILPNLAQVFPPLEIAEMVIAFADTLILANGSIAIYKLLLLLEVVKLVFDSAEARALLVPAMVRWVKPHLGRVENAASGDLQGIQDGKRIKWLECNRLAITVVACTISKLEEWLSSPLILEDMDLRMQEEDNIEYCLTLFPSLLTSYIELASPATSAALDRQGSSAAIYKTTPDVFPTSHPFALLSDLPQPSLLERHQHSDSDGLAHSGTFNCGLAESATVILSLVLAAPLANLSRFFSEMLDIEGIETCSTTLELLYDVCMSIIRFDAFPRQWLTLSLMCFQAILRILEPIADLMDGEAFNPPVRDAERFDVQLWTKCFELLCVLCGSDELALEDQTQQRRRAEWIMTGDLRDDGAALLSRLWNAIGWPMTDGKQNGPLNDMRYGGYQTRFTGLAEQILGLCLSSHDRMCEMAVEILFTMTYAEYVLVGHFDTIKTEIFAKLDKMFTARITATSDPTMRAYFVAQLRAVFAASPEIDARFHSKVGIFLDEVEVFIDLLLAVRNLPETPEWKDERAAATFRLMQFVRNVGRDDLYIRHVHYLLRLNLETRDWLGAGLALKMHAEMYDWKVDGDLVDVFRGGKIDLPAQSQFARRESLYYYVIDYFAEAEAYELALELCQELTEQHQRLTYQVAKLSELLVHQANLWDKIGQASRPKPEYFRVAYFGDFTPFNKDKDFVVRGQPWQQFSEFCDTIQHKHPSASIYRSKVAPPESMRNGEEQVIWITSVLPEPDLSHPIFGDSVAESVQVYRRYNEIRTFSSQRPYLVNPQEADPVLTWTEKTVLTTATMLPGVLSWAHVANIAYEQISPIANAIFEVNKAAKNLISMAKGRGGQPVDVKHLGTAINGAVDSPVNGGVKVYRKTFLYPSHIERYPQDSLQVEQLRVAILDYVRAIQESLSIHRPLCRDLAFHEALSSHFLRAFPDEISSLPRQSGSIESSPFPLPYINGHSAREASPSVPQLQLTTSLSRQSTISDMPRTSYVLPPLRLGPTPSPVDMSLLRRPPSVPASAGSSPRPIPASRSSGRSSLASPNRASSLGSRAMSLVGSFSGRSSISMAESEGTVGEEVLAVNGMKKEKGLKRFGSLMRRKN